ncbi:hypothetical protein [Bradyrhizobium neotropicale]|nr:hypothetical protein [Bradyrhizobium neotropicale]
MNSEDIDNDLSFAIGMSALALAALALTFAAGAAFLWWVGLVG